MDPLSITTAVLTCMSATGELIATVKKLRHLQHAPEEVEELENEISALRGNTESIESILGMYQSRQSEALRHIPLGKYIDAARSKTEEVNSFLTSSLLTSDTHKVKKTAWLKWQSQFNRLRQELRDVRMELGTCMNLLSAAGTQHNEMQIERLTIEGREMHARHLQFLETLRDELSQQRPALANEMQRQLGAFGVMMESTIHEANSSMVVPFAGRRRSEDLSSPSEETLVPPLPFRHRSRSTGGCAVQEEQALAKTHSSESTLVAVSSVQKAEDERHTMEPTVAVQLSQRMPGRCKGPCSCACHRTSKLKTPDFLRQVTGQLLIGYAGISSITPDCSEHACAQRQKATFRVQYHFPVWSLIQRVLTVVSCSGGARGPEKTLRLSRIRPGLHEVFLQVQSGNIRRLEQLFMNGEASPLDATDTGWSPLHYALAARQFHTAKFLKDAGADIHAESARRETPFDIAWNRILSGYLDYDSELTLREVFNDTEHLDERQFTPLHKIILGLHGRDLKDELEATTAQINTVDNSGYTPLAWACARGDATAAFTLLEYGASLLIANDLQDTPIHLAAQTGNIETVRVLVDAGADINAEVRQTRMTPMHYAAEYKDGSDLILGLADVGARVNAGDYMSWTPLHWASWRGHTASLNALIKCGADIHALAVNDYTSLLLAVANNSDACIRSLIASGAECGVVKDNKWSVLHYAAIGGTKETLEALANGDLSDIDVHGLKTTDTNQTVADMLAQRLDAMKLAGPDKEAERLAWEEAWKRLMKATLPSPRTRTTSFSSVGSSESDVFVDASPD